MLPFHFVSTLFCFRVVTVSKDKTCRVWDIDGNYNTTNALIIKLCILHAL